MVKLRPVEDLADMRLVQGEAARAGPELIDVATGAPVGILQHAMRCHGLAQIGLHP